MRPYCVNKLNIARVVGRLGGFRQGAGTRCSRIWIQTRQFSLPAHEVIPMPALSPTMESGTIGTWLVQEGEGFSAGQAICEVETDKATVTFDAQDDGFLAKILVGTDEIIVGAPLMVTVEEEQDVSAFKDFSVDSISVPASAHVPVSTPPAAAAPSAPKMHTDPPAVTSATHSARLPSGDRVFASPLARKLAKDAGLDVALCEASGPNGRVIASDVLLAIANGIPVQSQAHPAAAAVAVAASPSGVQMAAAPSVIEMAGSEAEMAALLTRTKQEVPHYYLSVEVNLEKLMALRDMLNEQTGTKENAAPLAVSDFVIKAAASAMKTVPDINGEWNETFVRQYDQVDINVVMGAGGMFMAPVLRDVNSLGVKQIADATASFEDSLFDEEGEVIDTAALGRGTFSIHNLGTQNSIPFSWPFHWPCAYIP